MAKSTTSYWNTLDESSRDRWQPVPDLEDMAEELTLSIDEDSGEYTRLTRFRPGADTSAFGPRSHDYPEEVYIVAGSLYDASWDLWLQAGHYASRAPGELHGPFRSEDGCTVLEISCPGRRKG